MAKDDSSKNYGTIKKIPKIDESSLNNPTATPENYDDKWRGILAEMNTPEKERKESDPTRVREPKIPSYFLNLETLETPTKYNSFEGLDKESDRTLKTDGSYSTGPLSIKELRHYPSLTELIMKERGWTFLTNITPSTKSDGSRESDEEIRARYASEFRGLDFSITEAFDCEARPVPSLRAVYRRPKPQK